GLVEAGEHVVGVERLELGVQVHPAVDGIGEAVQAPAVAAEGHQAVDLDDVLCGQAGEGDALRYAGPGVRATRAVDGHRLPVEPGGGDDEAGVEEGRRARVPAGEAQAGRGAGLVGIGQIEPPGDGDVGEQGGAGGRLV